MTRKQIPLLLMTERQRQEFNYNTFGRGAWNKSNCTGMWQERLMQTVKQNLHSLVSNWTLWKYGQIAKS